MTVPGRWRTNTESAISRMSLVRVYRLAPAMKVETI
jgi:hypothetical protein